MIDLIRPVIICGGSGSRLWPASREAFPKQFAQIFGDSSLFQQAIARFSGAAFEPPLVVTAEAFRFVASEQSQSIGIKPETVILEPEGRNTAPAVLAASLWAELYDPASLLLIVPADHVIANPEEFCAVVSQAKQAALDGQIVTFGIVPSRPETGYGYLHSSDGPGLCCEVKKFIEKPDLNTAKSMLLSQEYLWNSGIFLFRADVMIEAFRRHAPDLIPGVKMAFENKKLDLDFLRLDHSAWLKVPAISIDYAIMEHVTNLSVIKFSGKWSDLGSWDAVAEELATSADHAGNVVSQMAHAIDCKNSYLRSDKDGPRVVGIGLDELIVVASNDAILVAPRNQAQRVRDAVDLMRQEGLNEATSFRQDFRPWGWFESLAVGKRFQVKRIVVRPGGILSLQSHQFRSEHWIVVEGVARVTIANEIMLLSENQSVYIPAGEVHRLENPGDEPIVMIEVQTGSYLGEDDITRYEDAYDRN